MIEQTINIPEKDLSLFLELVNRFNWKLKTSEKSDFVLSEEQIRILDERSKSPVEKFISGEDSLAKLYEI